jgi:hypothetical protein
VSRTRLPLVLPPLPGESLSGWVLAMADAYGLTWPTLLRALGMPRPQKLRRLSIAPDPAWLDQLADTTGLDAELVRTTMTLGVLSRDLIPFVDAAGPCPGCPVTPPPGRWRPVEWLTDLAPWTLRCGRPGCANTCRALTCDKLSARMDRDLRHFSEHVRSAAPHRTTRAFPNVPVSLADALDLVRVVNGRIELCCSMDDGGPVVFDVLHVSDATNISQRLSRRRPVEPAISAWFVWHVLTAPSEAFWRNMRCRDSETVYDVLAVLFDPGQMGIVSPRWDYAMSLSRTAATALTKSNAEALQAAKVAAVARLCVAGRNPRRTAP